MLECSTDVVCLYHAELAATTTHINREGGPDTQVLPDWSSALARAGNAEIETAW